MSGARSVFLVSAIALAAACGGAKSTAPDTRNGGPASNGAASFGDASFRGPMRAPVATGMASELRAIGLDVTALPTLDHLPADVLRKVMKTFTASLGARCTDCHVEDDYEAPTPRKAIANEMWMRFTRTLRLTDGSPVYCDSCHQGHMTPLLDRHDVKALSQWMDDAFVHSLNRRDGKMHDCATCHGEPFEPHLLKAWSAPRRR